MRLLADSEFSTNDCRLVHAWLLKRGWIRDDEDPFRYLLTTPQGIVVANNLFDALKKELQEDLKK